MALKSTKLWALTSCFADTKKHLLAKKKKKSLVHPANQVSAICACVPSAESTACHLFQGIPFVLFLEHKGFLKCLYFSISKSFVMPREKWPSQKRKLASMYRYFAELKFTTSVDHRLVCRLPAARFSTLAVLAAIYTWTPSSLVQFIGLSLHTCITVSTMPIFLEPQLSLLGQHWVLAGILLPSARSYGSSMQQNLGHGWFTHPMKLLHQMSKSQPITFPAHLS